jgi:hypothetical protein
MQRQAAQQGHRQHGPLQISGIRWKPLSPNTNICIVVTQSRIGHDNQDTELVPTVIRPGRANAGRSVSPSNLPETGRTPTGLKLRCEA